MRSIKDYNDYELLRYILAGNPDGFRCLVDRYKDVSFSLAYSILKNREETEDTVQDAFLKVYRNLGNFRFDSSFATWLYRIVYNTAISRLEKLKSLVKPKIEEKNSEKDDSNTTFHYTLADDRKKFINKVLDSLKEKEALLLRLHYLGEQRITEIAEITGLSPSHVKVGLFRARENFYKKLDDMLGDEKRNLL